MRSEVACTELMTGRFARGGGASLNGACGSLQQLG